MPRSFCHIYVHITFATKNRYPLLREDIRNGLTIKLRTLCEDWQCAPLAIGGFDDHMYVLYKLSRTISISKLVEVIKSISSMWLKQNYHDIEEFSWQRGYGAFSVEESSLPRLIHYILNQEAHHTE